MSATDIYTLILSLIIFDFGINQLLEFLNNKSRKQSLPKELINFYSEEKYLKSQAYQKEKYYFSFISSLVNLIIMVVLVISGGFGWLDAQVRTMVSGEINTALVFFGIIFLGSDLLSLPFAIYNTFKIEENYGFNKTTWKTFLLDKIKGYILTIVLGGGLLYLLLFLILNLSNDFWWYFWAVATLFVVFINIFYTTLIIPLFNKLTPLQDGELKQAILEYSKTVNFPLDNIYIIDGSKRSSKANAFFSGIGSRKKIVLYDTLIENYSIDELVAILAHEVGHYKQHHIIQGLLMSICQLGIMLFIMSLLIFNVETSIALGGNQWSIAINLLAFGILYSPISMLIGIVGNLFSRKNEYEADHFAKVTYKGKSLATALKKLSADNLTNLFPHKAYEFVYYSHPTLLSRLSALET